jgi:hypothetical protein
MIRRSSARQTGSGPLLKGKATAFAVYVCGAGLTYLAQLMLARVIGMAAYGTYAYVLGIVTLLAYLAALGFDVSLLRFLPAYKSQQQWGLMRDIVVYSERNATCAGVVIAVLGLAAIVASGHASRHGTILTFAAGFGLVPVYALLWIRCARVRAFGGVASALIPDRAVRDGFVLAAILLAALLPAGAFGAPTAMAITLLGGIAGLGMVQAIRHQRTLMDAPARLPAGFSEACRPISRMARPGVVHNGRKGMFARNVLLKGVNDVVRRANIWSRLDTAPATSSRWPCGVFSGRAMVAIEPWKTVRQASHAASGQDYRTKRRNGKLWGS